MRTESEERQSETGNLAGARANSSRLRLILEGTRRYALEGGGSITPALEVGVRQDGGDAETGAGIEAGARVSFRRRDLTVEGSVRTLVSHEDDSYEEWGASATVRVEPGRDGRGLSFALTPTWGATGSAMDRLWGLDNVQGLAPEGDFEAGQRIEAAAGYGMPAFGGRFTGTPEVGLGMADGVRELRLGWRLEPVGGGWGPFGSFGLNVVGAHREPADDNGRPERRVGVVLEARF